VVLWQTLHAWCAERCRIRYIRRLFSVYELLEIERQRETAAHTYIHTCTETGNTITGKKEENKVYW
jgi:hypothetical protein